MKQMMNNKLRILLTIALCIIVNACASKPTTHSYFGDKRHEFRPGPKGGADLIWTPKSVRNQKQMSAILRSYDNIMVNPVLVSFADSDSYDGLDNEELQELAEIFRQDIIAALSKHYRIVDHPGSKTLEFTAAITGIERPARFLAATSTVTPVGRGLSVVSRVTRGEHTNVGKASIEAAMMDSTNKHILFAVIDEKAGGKDIRGILDTTHGAKDAFKSWSKRLDEVLTEMEVVRRANNDS